MFPSNRKNIQGDTLQKRNKEDAWSYQTEAIEKIVS